MQEKKRLIVVSLLESSLVFNLFPKTKALLQTRTITLLFKAILIFSMIYKTAANLFPGKTTLATVIWKKQQMTIFYEKTPH